MELGFYNDRIEGTYGQVGFGREASDPILQLRRARF